MSDLPNAIARRWEDRVRTGTEVMEIARNGQGWLVRTDAGEDEADRLVIATDAATAAGLLGRIDPALATALGSIVYPPVASAVSLYDRSAIAHPLDGFGVLVPELERRNVLGVIFSSTLFPGRAPEGTVALTTFIGGARQPEMALRSREEIERDVYREHGEMLGASAPPRSFDLTVWKRAIPQYNLGYGRILDEIARAERDLPGLHLLGNYRGGVSVGDCVKSAWEMAARIESR
jgi:oxygen-dependent protoporphyrinogen oxidase